jgi:hypothetical protein
MSNRVFSFILWYQNGSLSIDSRMIFAENKAEGIFNLSPGLCQWIQLEVPHQNYPAKNILGATTLHLD